MHRDRTTVVLNHPRKPVPPDAIAWLLRIERVASARSRSRRDVLERLAAEDRERGRPAGATAR